LFRQAIVRQPDSNITEETGLNGGKANARRDSAIARMIGF
jgi:hypothetical protein